MYLNQLLLLLVIIQKIGCYFVCCVQCTLFKTNIDFFLMQVYVDQLSVSDMEYIAETIFPAIGKNIISKMVHFNHKVNQEVMVERKWGQKGGPWEFNLRDLFRWCQLMLVDQMPGCYDPGQHVVLVYADRMRTEADRRNVRVTLYCSFYFQPILAINPTSAMICPLQLG